MLDLAAPFAGWAGLPGATGVLPVGRQSGVACPLFQESSEFDDSQFGHDAPRLVRNGHLQAATGAGDLLCEGIAGEGLLHHLFAMGGAQGGFHHGQKVVRHPRQAEGEQGALGYPKVSISPSSVTPNSWKAVSTVHRRRYNEATCPASRTAAGRWVSR